MKGFDMNNFFENIRYGSGIFMYIVSSFILSNIVLARCLDIYSFLSFLLVAFIISVTAFSKNQQININSTIKRKLKGIITVAALLLSLIYELSIVLNVFRASSDNASTVSGMYVFAFIIMLSSYLCTLHGFDTILKISNIVFIIPVIALSVTIFGLFTSGATMHIIDFSSGSIINSLFSGATAAILVLSDVYIISYMLKAEKCYSLNISRGVYFLSLLIIIAFSALYRMMFGIDMSTKLYAPVISAAGLIDGISLEEIYLFAYSVCLLFRSLCRVNIMKHFVEKLGANKKTATKILLLLLVISALAGGFCAQNMDSSYLVEKGVIISFTIAFVILPILLNILHREKS